MALANTNFEQKHATGTFFKFWTLLSKVVNAHSNQKEKQAVNAHSK